MVVRLANSAVTQTFILMDIFNSIEFREPLCLLLALQPIVLLVIVFMLRRLRRTAYCDRALLPWTRAPRGKYLWQQSVRHLLLLLAWTSLAIALAGPRQAEHIYHSDKDDLAEVYLLVDVSRSMNATDVLPNRLARAQLEISQLLQQKPVLRIGLIVFAARPHLLSPPTTDTAVLNHYLQQLHTRMLPTEGSDLAQAINFSSRQFADSSATPRAILLFTDGEITPAIPSAQQALYDSIANLKSRHIILHTVGLGTAAGAALIDAEQGWLQYQGQAVLSRLQEQQLQDIAVRGNGHYHSVSDNRSRWPELLTDDLQSLLRQSHATNGSALIVWRELYGYPLLLGALLFILAHWQTAPRRQRLVTPSLLSLLTLIVCLSDPSSPLQAAELSYRDAHAEYAQQHYAQAAQAFAKLSGYAARLGEGSALYRLGKFPQASVAFIQATLQADDDPQRAHALFNLANCYYQQQNYATAITTYQDVLRYQPDMQAAKINLGYAQALFHEQAATDAPVARQPGRGPRTALAPADMPLSQSAVTLDNSDNDFPLPTVANPTNEQATVTITHARPATSNIDRGDDRDWTYDIQHVDPSQMSALLQLHNESYVWQRLFEWEENFPAPVKDPHSLPGVPPW